MTAITATLLPNGKQQFLSATGTPLAGGTVGFYLPGTLTPKTTWLDPYQDVANENPIILDAAGEAIIYGFGQYRQIVRDSLGNLIWDQLTNDLLSLAQTGQYWGGTSGGTANAQTIATTPGFSSYVEPIVVSFIAGFTNTGTLTINANGIGALNVTKQTTAGPVPLTGGEVVNGNVYQISYDGTEWQLLNTTPANPTGTIITFAVHVAPNGYIECDGSAISRTDFSPLFSVIGTTFGTGDGTTTFNLPDLRGQFIRGWSDTGMIDPSRTFGSNQAEDIQPHTHPITDAGHTHGGQSGENFVMAFGAAGQYSTGGTGTPASVTASATTGITINKSTGTETRPVNVALLYCIKI